MLNQLKIINTFLLMFLASSMTANLGAAEAASSNEVLEAQKEQNFSYEAKQAILSEDLERAGKLIEAVLEKHPEDAESYRVAGDIYVTRAQSASLFSAPGLAKKGLKSYLKSVELAPKNVRYRLNLLQYYLQAPSIVGGNKDKAVEQASKIKELNTVKGIIAQGIINTENEDLKAREALLSSLDEELANQPQIKLEKAQYLLNSGKFEQGLNELEVLAAIPSNTFTDKDDKKVPFKALLTMGFLGLKDEGIDYTEKSITAFEKYIETAPKEYGYPSKPWIRFALAKLYAQNEQTELAKAAFEQIQQESQSKQLLKETKKALKKL